jgi:selenide, water dikinase
LDGLSSVRDVNLVEDFSTLGDAGVYRISPDTALVQTVDIITPVCDDPFVYGQIAAANSLSDIYAMGGRPLTALNVCCFPSAEVDSGALRSILLGAADVLRISGAALLGGHTVRDDELKFGLSVTGLVHPNRFVSNSGARPGDRLIITKRLGTGLIISGIRSGRLPAEAFGVAALEMVRLNDTASTLMVKFGAHACTDVSGFGLAGHALGMARASNVSFEIWVDAIPYFDKAIEMVQAGVKTGLTESNQKVVSEYVRGTSDSPLLEHLLYDPQTSGGLLIVADSENALELLAALKERGLPARMIGRALDGPVAGLILKSGNSRV